MKILDQKEFSKFESDVITLARISHPNRGGNFTGQLLDPIRKKLALERYGEMIYSEEQANEMKDSKEPVIPVEVKEAAIEKVEPKIEEPKKVSPIFAQKVIKAKRGRPKKGR